MSQLVQRKGLIGSLGTAATIAAGTQAYGAIVVSTPPSSALAPAAIAGAATGVAWDVDGDSTIDFIFTYRRPTVAAPASGTPFPYQANMLRPASTSLTAVVGTFGGYCYASKLATSAVVGSASAFVNGTQGSYNTATGTQVILGSRFGAVNYGGFATTPTVGGTSTGFVGFSFNTPSGVRYGYLNLTVVGTADLGTPGIIFNGGAYEDSGASITIPIPEPTSVAFLAVGAAAILNRRKKAN